MGPRGQEGPALEGPEGHHHGTVSLFTSFPTHTSQATPPALDPSSTTGGSPWGWRSWVATRPVGPPRSTWHAGGAS